MQIDKVNKVIVGEPLIVHKVRKVEKEPTDDMGSFIRVTPTIVYETTYDSKGRMGSTVRMFGAHV